MQFAQVRLVIDKYLSVRPTMMTLTVVNNSRDQELLTECCSWLCFFLKITMKTPSSLFVVVLFSDPLKRQTLFSTCALHAIRNCIACRGKNDEIKSHWK